MLTEWILMSKTQTFATIRADVLQPIFIFNFLTVILQLEKT